MRRLSIGLAIGGLVVPFAWAYLATNALYRDAAAHHVHICGLPALANFLLASFACILTSASAAVLGFIVPRRLPAPRPKRRLAEITALGLPLFIVGGSPESPALFSQG
jgi:hypothetical protein